MSALHPQVEAALGAQAAKLSQPADLWIQAFVRLLPYLPATSFEQQVKLIAQLSQATDCIHLADALTATHHTPGWLQDLTQYVDRSSSPLPQWIEALTLSLAWWRQHHPHTQPSLHQLTGYLSCCAEYDASRSIRISFPHTVEEMLADYGIQSD